MLDSSPAAGATADASPFARPVWPSVFLALAGLIGAAGVGVGAAGAHMGGGELTRTASDYMLVHAAAVVAGAGSAHRMRRPPAVLAAALGLLTVGAVLFGGELSVAALLAWRPLPLAAPIGGTCLIAGWLCFTASAIVAGRGGG